MTVKIYQYEKCNTCRDALKFMERQGIAFSKVAIVDQPPSLAELRQMLQHLGGDLKKLFNTSGAQYRELQLSTKLPKMSEAEALTLLSQNGKLIKRPFALTASTGTVGFKETEWKKLFC